MKTQSFNKTLLKVGKLLIGSQSRHSYNGKIEYFIDFGSFNLFTLKF